MHIFLNFRLKHKLQALECIACLAISCVAYAQGARALENEFTSSGTIIVIDFEAERILVAAESRQTGLPLESRDHGCKIIPLGKRMFFTLSGRSVGKDQSGVYIDTYKAARSAFGAFRNAKNTPERAKLVATRWAQLVRAEYQKMLIRDPEGFSVQLRNGELAIASFGSSTDSNELLIYTVFVTYYFRPEGEMPRAHLTPQIHTDVLPWKQRLPVSPGSSVYYINGSQDRIGVSEFIDAKTVRAKNAEAELQSFISKSIHPDVDALTLEYAVKAATEWAVNKGDVGGEVDVLELPRNADFRWLKVKKECSK
jgi:hypothetical protein